ncbi:NACHT domain-containing protein [Streptomyces griseochromogenes]|uniref:NACHT domain-containing protein n=1 Tax=Streptomyces griseochromogenes TaxID=68214 RepID=UPI0037B9DD2C
MEPTVLGGKLASGLIGPLVKKLFVADGPGAGLVDKPVRLSALVSFRGEKRTLTEKDVHRLAERLVAQAVESPGEAPFPAAEQPAVAEALARRLLALGDLEMDDVQAVRLGHRELAKKLHYGATTPEGLSPDAHHFLDSATEWACLQVLEFFTRRSTFVARTLVEQSRAHAELIAKVDELIARIPRPDARDTAFERRYLPYVAKKHSKLTIYGIDLSNSPGQWPLSAAYLSLEVTGRGGEPLPGLPSAAPLPTPADQTLAGHDRVLLRGVAGSGKTTLIQWLAVSAATDPTDRMAHLAGRMPFVLPLRTLTRHGEPLPAPAGFLRAVGCPLAGAQPEGWEDRVLTGGRALVLVDGLDEVPEAERERTRRWLSDLVETFPGNRWLVTSRPSAVRDDWLTDEDFTELRLSSMSPADVAAFIGRWHRAAVTGNPDADALLASYESQLLHAVRTKGDLGRLATNPLMCGLICALHRDRRGYLPHGRKELYESALSMLLVRRDRERDMAGPELSEEPQLQLLQRLAYWLIRNGRTEMDRSRAERIVGEILPAVPAASALGDTTDVLEHFLIRTGLLLSPGPDTLHFVHRTFQDFLGARAAVEAGDLGLLAEHATDDQWADVIRMAVAQARPRERAELLDLLMAVPAKRAHLLAMACLEHATQLDPAVRRRVEELASALLPPGTAEEARELAEAGPLVLELLPGPDGLTDDQAEAVTATAALVGTDGSLPVLARFSGHSEWRVRNTPARAWERYDLAAYADEILAHVDSADFFICITTPETLRELPRIGHRARMLIQGPHDLRTMLEALPAGVQRLALADNPLVEDLRPLTALTALDMLNLANCPGTGDLTPLTELALSELYLTGLGGVAGLDRLDTLSHLQVMTSLSGGLADLPRSAPLTSLGLGEQAVLNSGLRGLGQWATLEHLTLRGEGSFLGRADWHEVAALPSLTGLSIDTAVVPSSTGAPELTGIELIQVTRVQQGDDLSALAGLCPRARTVKLYQDSTAVSLHEADYAPLFPHAQVTVAQSRPYAL